MSRKISFFVLLALVVLASASTGFAASDYPSQPIRLIVPFSPGGGTDVCARIVAEGMSKYLDQPVIIENRPGASGTVGTLLARGEKADGYTLLFGIQATLAMNPMLYKSAKYSPKEFDAVALLTESPYLIYVSGKSEIMNREDFLEASKKRVTLANGASAAYLAARLLEKRMGVQFAHIPYSGTGPAISDILAGRVDACISSPVAPLPHIKSGAMRPILVTGMERIPDLPDTPTANEMGFEGFKVVGWYGVVAPKGVPRDRLEMLNDVFNKTIADEKTKERLLAVGLIPNSDAFKVDDVKKFIDGEYELWAAEIKDAGLEAK